MTTHEAQNIKEKIAGYNLLPALQTRLEVIIVGGVAVTTIYKAFREGGRTPTLRTILAAAQELVEDHEQSIEEYIQDTPPTDTTKHPGANERPVHGFTF